MNDFDDRLNSYNTDSDLKKIFYQMQNEGSGCTSLQTNLISHNASNTLP